MNLSHGVGFFLRYDTAALEGHHQDSLPHPVSVGVSRSSEECVVVVRKFQLKELPIEK